MPDSESGNWPRERSQMVSGGLKLPSLFPYQHKTLASHGKQLTPTQGASIDRDQHPPMVKKEASCQTDFDNKHKIQTAPTSKNSGHQANRKKRRATVSSLLPAIDMPTQRSRPTRPRTFTFGECMGSKFKDLEIQQLQAEKVQDP